MDDNQEGEGNQLPDVVISDIMSRLRAKTIGLLRMESSIIVSLTTSQYFIQKHLLFAKGDINQYGLLIFCEYEYDLSDSIESSYRGSDSSEEATAGAANKEIHRFSLNSFLDRDISCFMTEDPFPEEPWVLVGNANGIFCLHCNDGRLILWNPTTTRVKRTSSWNDLVGLPIRSYNTSCGFGFGEHMNEYFGMVLYNVSDFEFLALIYRATTNSWRLVASFRDLNGLVEERMVPQNFDIVFVADKFHWTVSSVETVEMIENLYIVSFDPETEMYRRLEKPREHSRFVYLGSMGTCLSLCCLNEDLGTWEIWMWEDDTWNIAFKLANTNMRGFSSMCRLPDGQLLLGCELGVVCCNLNDDTYRVVEYPEEIARRVLIQSEFYLETMVSPAELELVAGA
ncbi:F-box/kelch-repeat protein At3g06240-like [Primulina eburnea]|uniref:F-box/kelch-repeat protein At3g06240-like n=1 Tax=Primulina eburnea TaxID=1245227 RepID=UPI003C6BF1FC